MYWVSYVGDDAVAAIALTFPTVWLNVSLGLGVTIAGVAFVSQFTGAGKTDEAGRVAGQVILLATSVAIVLGGLGIMARQTILTLMGAEGQVLTLGTDYLKIVLAGLPFQYIYLTFRSVAQGTGDSKTPRNLLIVTVLINATLDPFLILGLAGLPALGVSGAAWATFTAEGIGAMISLIYLANGRIGGVRLRLSHLKPDWDFLKRAAAIGLPGSFDMGMRGLSSVVTAGIVARFGAVEAAAYGIVMRIMSVVWTSAGAMEQSVTSGVGQSLGAKKPNRAERIAWTGAGVMFTFLSVVAIVIYIFAEPVIGVFQVTEDVVRTGARFIRLHILSYGFWGAFEVIQGAFRGAGRTLPPAMMTMGSRWIFQIPLAIVASYYLGYGADGYWRIFFFTNIAFFLISVIWFRRGTWKEQALVH